MFETKFFTYLSEVKYITDMYCCYLIVQPNRHIADPFWRFQFIEIFIYLNSAKCVMHMDRMYTYIIDSQF